MSSRENGKMEAANTSKSIKEFAVKGRENERVVRGAGRVTRVFSKGEEITAWFLQ